MTDQQKTVFSHITSYVLMAFSLLMILKSGLLSAFFSGLLVYSLVHMLTPILGRKIKVGRAKTIAVALLGILVVSFLSLAIWGAINFFRSDAGSVPVLLQKMSDIIEASSKQMPEWLQQNLPLSADELRQMITTWLHAHSVEAKSMGEEAGRIAAHVLLGMVIGAMVALHEIQPALVYPPLSAALRRRLIHLHDAFQRIVFAQVRIAAINAALVAVYLFIVLPLSGIHLPLSKSIVVFTFFAGLLPIIGNILSNAILVIVALSHSFNTALVSLIFMMLIHKLEYFLNARIISSKINAAAWELLTAILVMEAVFGMAGVIAAPVMYAYLKIELMNARLV